MRIAGLVRIKVVLARQQVQHLAVDLVAQGVTPHGCIPGLGGFAGGGIHSGSKSEGGTSLSVIR